MFGENEIIETSRRGMLGLVGVSTIGGDSWGDFEEFGTRQYARLSENSGWPVFNYDPAGTNHAPAENGPDPSNIDEEWSTSFGTTRVHAPVVDNHKVFCVTGGPDNQLASLHSQTGEKIWTQELDGPSGTSPAVTGGQVLVPISSVKSSHVRRIESRSGVGESSDPTDETSIERILVSKADFFLGTNAGVTALRKNTGLVAWNSEPFRRVTSTEELAVTDSTVYAVGARGTAGHRADGHDAGVGILAALDRKTGDTRWTIQRPTHISSVAAVDGYVVIASQNSVSVLDTSDGSQVWSSELFASGGIAVANGKVLVGGYGRVTAHSLQDGLEQWSHEISANDVRPAAYGNTVVVVGNRFDSDEGRGSPIHFIDLKTGEVVSREQLKTPRLTAPAIADERVFVGTDHGTLHAFSGSE